jgi:hypothetical protein
VIIFIILSLYPWVLTDRRLGYPQSQLTRNGSDVIPVVQHIPTAFILIRDHELGHTNVDIFWVFAVKKSPYKHVSSLKSYGVMAT